jgi:hypothetical protein
MRIAPFLLLAAGFLAQDKGLRKLEWKLAPGHAAEFVFLDKAGKPLGDQKLMLFASELTPHSNRIQTDTYDEIPLPLLFQLPSEPFKNGLGWEFAASFFADSFESTGGFQNLVGTGSIRPVTAKGRYILKIAKKGDDEIASIDGAFTLYEIRRDMVNNQMKLIVTKNEMGSLATSTQISVSKGMLLKAAWQYKVRAQERENGRPVDKKIETHGMLEFREDLELEPAKIQASLGTAISRAADWLKKQQKNGAWTPTHAQAPPSETLYLTALAVRALAAAGVKPDDPALLAASKILRSPAPSETFYLSQQILALSSKSPTKDEAEDARRLAEELLRRRDPRSAGWGPAAGRNDTPNVALTALALEALATAPDAKVPEDVYKSGLEAISGGWMDDEGAVELDVEFEKDATTFPIDPKKNVVPAIWPAQLGRAGGNDFRSGRKGSFFTVAAALRTLLVVPEKLKMDEKQQKALEAPLRKGFANLQMRWTLRTVPPVEAPWCAQRLEYLGLLGPLLSRAKINRIAGSDWRLEGTTLLLQEQGDDGSWHSGTDQAVAKTAHALLFLASARR